jgi:hypothetical protein
MSYPDEIERKAKSLEASGATFEDLALALRRIKELEAELARLRTPCRTSLEVLQRMANGIEPFDAGRYKSAVAALPHETPKLSATIATFGGLGIGDRLDARKRVRLRLIESEPEPVA